MNENLYRIAKSFIETDGIVALARVVSSSGSTPGKKGHIILVGLNKKTSGSVGGGALELKVIEDCSGYIKDFADSNEDCSEIFKKDLTLSLDKDSDLKMACTGAVTLEYRVFKRDCKELKTFLYLDEAVNRLVIFGAGHVAKALVPMAKNLGFIVAVCDDRASFVTKDMHPLADSLNLVDYKNFEKTFKLKKNDWILIMTQGHLGDINILKSLIKFWKNLSYIGVIGSSKKIALADEEIKKAGAPDEMISFIHGPVGFKVGGRSAYEIAISIACELIAVEYGYR